MKLLKRIMMNSNNKGLSLVELICAVAILGISMTAIGSAMVVSAQHYQRNSTEFDVQQEVQTTTNLIGNLIVDAVDAKWTDSTKKLELDGEGVTYCITWDETTGVLSYTEDTGVGGTTSGVLAENVTHFLPHVASDFKSNKNVRIELTVDKNGKKYDSSYNTLARSGEVSYVAGAILDAEIDIDVAVVVEPGQTYRLPIALKDGMLPEQVEGFKWTIANKETYLDGDFTATNEYIEFKLKDDIIVESFTIHVETNKEKAVNTPCAEADVAVRVRRVNAVDLVVSTPNSTENGYGAGTVILFEGIVDGYEMTNGVGTNYDSLTYPYKNPRYVDFNYSIVGMSNVTVNVVEDSDNPYIEFTLNEYMDAGDGIYVTATAKHPEGEWEGTFTNKASAQNNMCDPYGHYEDYDEYKHVQNGPYPGVAGLKRGDNDFLVLIEPASKNDRNSVIGDYQTNTGRVANVYVNSMRFGKTEAELNACEWIPVPTTGGDADLFLRTEHSCLFEPFAEYIIEIKHEVFDATDQSIRVWPVDGVTDSSLYLTRFTLPAVQVLFKSAAAGEDSYVDRIGTQSNPVALSTGRNSMFNLRTQNMNMKFLYSDISFEYDYYNSGWNSAGNVTKGFEDSALNDVMNLSVFLQPLQQNQTRKTYRILPTLNYKQYYHIGGGSFAYNTTVYPLYDLGTGKGTIYITEQ